MNLENWKHIGALLTGIAALITASIPIVSFMNTSYKEKKQAVFENKVETKTKKQYAFINDPDGWVNLRVAPNVNSGVIRRIESGYRVEILDREGNWVKVKTYIDEIGFIYYDRLKQ